MTAVFEIIALILGFALPLLKEWLEAENRKRRAYEADIQAFDRALVDRDTDQLSRVFDELRVPDGGDPGGPDDQKPA